MRSTALGNICRDTTSAFGSSEESSEESSEASSEEYHPTNGINYILTPTRMEDLKRARQPHL